MPRSRSATCAARFSPGLSRSTPSLPCPAPGSWPPRWTAGSGLNFLLYMDILMEAGREWNWPEIRGQRMNRPASSSSPAARNASRTATPSALSSTSTNRWTGRSWLQALETNLCLHHRPDRVTLRLGSKTSVLPLDTLLYAKSQSHGTVAAFPNGQLRKHSSAAATAAHSRKKEAFMIVFASRRSPPILFCLV